MEEIEWAVKAGRAIESGGERQRCICKKMQERYKKHMDEEGHKSNRDNEEESERQAAQARKYWNEERTYCGEIMDMVRNGHSWKEEKEFLSVQRMGKSSAQLGQPLR